LRILKLLEWEKQTISSCNNILSAWDPLKKAATKNLCLGFLNFPCALMKAFTGWWCHVLHSLDLQAPKAMSDFIFI
jgi:hypothetical protein